MNKEQIYTQYLNDLTLQGKSLKNVKYCLKIYFQYLNDYGLNYRYVKIKDAQNFQMHLTTLNDSANQVRFSRASVLNIIGCVSEFYEYLRKSNMIHSNPFHEVDRVKRSKALPRNILNEKDMNTFLNHLKGFSNMEKLIERRQMYRAHVVAEVMYSTGVRINEIATLKSSDVDFNRGTITITDSKTGKKRDAILNSFAEKVLWIYLDEMRDYVVIKKSDPGLVFGGSTNLKIWMNTILNRESEKLKLGKFTTHNFRHAVGYHLLRGGCDIRFIQDILGHKALHSTQIYTKVEKEDLKNVIDTFHPRIMKSSQHNDHEDL